LRFIVLGKSKHLATWRLALRVSAVLIESAKKHSLAKC
jgi:hypothetical protein